MKVLYLADQIYLHGGAEKILIQKLNYWADVYGYEVALVTTAQKGRPPFLPVSGKVRHIDLNIGYPEGSLYHPRNFGRFRTHYKKLKAAISDVKPDAVFVISQTLNHIIAPFASGSIPAFYEYHTSWQGFRMGYEKMSAVHKLKTRFIRIFSDYAESRYRKIVYLNQTEFERFGRPNAVVIPNFFDDSREIVKAERENTVITLGRLSHEKRYDRLIEAWKILDDSISGWQLHIYGNGVEKQKLEQLIENGRFKNPVKLFPATDNVNEKLARASIYALSSEVETFPMALLEALSNGLPVVAFDCPSGPRSILTDGADGLLVEPGNPKALADGLSALIGNPDARKRMGANASVNVGRFSPPSVMAKWDALIRQNVHA